MITGKQIRAGMSALRLSRRQLSNESKVPPRTLQRIVEADDVPKTNAQHLEAIQRTLENGNEISRIEFFNAPAPGIVILPPQELSNFLERKISNL